MSNSVYKCICCNREYQRKLFYDKHILLCHLTMTKSLAELKKDHQEQADTPTVRVLYEIILEMNAKIIKLEERLEERTKWIETKKRKINIVDWLNEKYNPYPASYMSWLNNIKINRHHLEMIFEMDFVLGISFILQNLLPFVDGETMLPMKCFNQKDNIIFIFHEEKWQIMSVELFDKLMMYLSKKLISEFLLWQKDNIDKIENDDNFAIIHNNNLKKVMGGSVNIELLGLRVKKELYKYLKTQQPVTTSLNL